MMNSSQIKKEKEKKSILHAQNNALKILGYLLTTHMVPLSFSIANVLFERYFEFYRTLLQSICCFSLGIQAYFILTFSKRLLWNHSTICCRNQTFSEEFYTLLHFQKPLFHWVLLSICVEISVQVS